MNQIDSITLVRLAKNIKLMSALSEDYQNCLIRVSSTMRPLLDSKDLSKRFALRPIKRKMRLRQKLKVCRYTHKKLLQLYKSSPKADLIIVNMLKPRIPVAFTRIKGSLMLGKILSILKASQSWEMK